MDAMANTLLFGCDCVGVGAIHYLPCYSVERGGPAIKVKNVFCIREEDTGVMWEHSDYGLRGLSFATRSRRVFVGLYCTLVSYSRCSF